VPQVPLLNLGHCDNLAPTQGNTSSGCTYTQGIDWNYPYAGIIPGTSPPQALDGPGVALPSGYVVNRSFNATMFLMWTSNLPNSIPVPIGYPTWGFSGGAQKDSSQNWSVTTNGTPGPFGGFVSSTGSQTTDGYTTLQDGYPLWSGPAAETCN
jgi:hypothetical protein